MTPRLVAVQGIAPGRSPLAIATQGFLEHACVTPLRVALQGLAGGLTARQIALQGLGPCFGAPTPAVLPAVGGRYIERARRRRRDRDDDVLVFLL